MFQSRFLLNYGKHCQSAAWLLQSRRATQTLFQPAQVLSFASREAEAVEEVEIVSDSTPDRPDRDRNSDNAFHAWLRKDLKSASDKQVDWKRKKRSVFDKMGYNDKHLPHQGNYPKNKKK